MPFSITYLPYSYYRGSQRSSQPEMGGGVQYYMNPMNPSTPPPRPENTSVRDTIYTVTVAAVLLTQETRSAAAFLNGNTDL